MPNVIPIYEADWPIQSPPFDKYTALRLGISDVSDSNGTGSNGDRQDVYDFKINMDNLFFKSELKDSSGDELLRARWKYGLVLVGLALLHDDAQRQRSREAREDNDDETGPSIEERVEEFTKAIAPVLLPMINSLGSLPLEAPSASSGAGEAT